MPAPVIDIITRTYNRVPLLRRCMRALLAQTEVRWNWVIVNNGSAPEVEQLLWEHVEELNGKAVLIHHQERCNIGRLTNIGIRASTSPLITLLDDDDTWEPEFLERTVHRLGAGKLHPSVRGVCTQSACIHESIDEAGKATEIRRFPFNPGLRNIHLATLAAVNQFPPNAFVYERGALEEVGLYDESLPVLDDWDFNLRFNLVHNIDLIHELLANYHLRPGLGGGSFSNTVTASENLHRFYEGVIINQYLREDLAAGRSGLGTLLANAGTRRVAESMLNTQRKKLEHLSEKIGKIDSRTKVLKDSLPRARA